MGTLVPQRILNSGGVPAYAVYQTSTGQYIWVGHENGVSLFRRDGERLLSYPTNDFQLPVIGIASKDDFSKVYLCAREGKICCLKLDDRWLLTLENPSLYKTDKPDFHSIAYAPESGLLVIGHLSQGLAAIRENKKEPLWRMHPSLGNATDADSWIVTTDHVGQYLYVGSAMASSNYLVSLDPQTGSEQTPRCYLDTKTKITGQAALPSGGGVLVALAEWDSLYGYVGKLVLYDADLSGPIWEKPFEDTITAIYADSNFPRAVVSSGFNGNLKIIDTKTGDILADDYTLNSLANQLSLTQGCYIAAANQNGNLALIQYRP